MDAEMDRARVSQALTSAITMADGTELLDKAAFMRVLNDVYLGRIFIVELEPSFGASIYIVCKSVILDDIVIA